MVVRINKMLSCAGADRLQTGMRGAFGKPYGQVLLSLRCVENKTDSAQEALRRASAKIPGRQKIHVSQKWGFTHFTKEEYQKHQGEGRLIPKGNHVQWLSSRGPLSRLIGRK